MKQVNLFLTLLLFLLYPLVSTSGVILTAHQNNTTTKDYIEGKWLKSVTGNFEFIFNGSKKTAYLVNHKEKSVTITTQEDLAKMKKFSAMMGNSFGYTNQKPPKITTKVVKIGRKRIAGCNTTGYKIYSDNSDVEEVYFCNDSKLIKSFNTALANDLKEFSSFNESQDIYNYNLKKYGIPFLIKDVKRNQIIYEVKNVEYKKLKSSTFSYPKNYKIIRTADMFKQIPQIPQGLPGNIPNIPGQY
ncbi:hypothetical protein DEFDS_1614 [Deferribacter desulfuricans SSM1]|uniref:DUF4412 domain-containing protein n=1 Tax=Deferribacter desulfuricans (strain DSM 14783 / JCM 11476 / NBRC 101012 / SSM1) TaxID=639282 RepID=D3P8N2_DEFDS|nr:DUF4412 domain-containing protein [Deferribacter desulfuricans]BAI81072.1 hypothetical protein DEFDS_1614 [Deferribacter desulfuricans SSM1]